MPLTGGLVISVSQPLIGQQTPDVHLDRGAVVERRVVDDPVNKAPLNHIAIPVRCGGHHTDTDCHVYIVGDISRNLLVDAGDLRNDSTVWQLYTSSVLRLTLGVATRKASGYTPDPRLLLGFGCAPVELLAGSEERSLSLSAGRPACPSPVDDVVDVVLLV